MNVIASAPTTCPAVSELAAFDLGMLDADALESVAEHLKGCSSCMETLANLAAPEDELVSGLRCLKGSLETPLDKQVEDELAELLTNASKSPESAAEIAPPRAIREYELVEKIGEGGMGAVYRAVHANLGKNVALKLLARHRFDDEQAVARFHREMKAVGRLNHPHI